MAHPATSRRPSALDPGRPFSMSDATKCGGMDRKIRFYLSHPVGSMLTILQQSAYINMHDSHPWKSWMIYHRYQGHQSMGTFVFHGLSGRKFVTTEVMEEDVDTEWALRKCGMKM